MTNIRNNKNYKMNYKLSLQGALLTVLLFPNCTSMNSDKKPAAPAAHKETGHYLAWRDAVKDMMAEPRSAIKYNNLFPATSVGWDYGNGASLE